MDEVALRQTLTNFYAVHGKEKTADDINLILLRFAGKYERLVHELEKKYAVNLMNYAASSPAMPGAAVAAAEAYPSPEAPRTLETGLTATEGASLAPPAPPPAAVEPPEPPPALAPSPVPVMQQASRTPQLDLAPLVASLRSEVGHYKGLCEALRREKEVAGAAARREVGAMDNRLKDQQKRFDEAQRVAEARTKSEFARCSALAAQAGDLQTALEASRRETQAARSDAASRAEQLLESLEAQQRLASQLDQAILAIGEDFDPYGEAPVARGAARGPPSGPPSDASSGGTAAATAEVRLLCRAKVAAEAVSRDQAAKLASLEAALASLESSGASSGASLKAQVASLTADLASRDADLAAARAQAAEAEAALAKASAEVSRLRSTVALAAATRREMGALAERERTAVLAAARERIGEATNRLLKMELEDALSAAAHAHALELEQERAGRDLLALELEDLSGAAVALRAERQALTLETKHLRAQVRRASEVVLQYAPAHATEGILGVMTPHSPPAGR